MHSTPSPQTTLIQAVREVAPAEDASEEVDELEESSDLIEYGGLDLEL